MPKLSIITINYNNVQGLQKTVESVIAQSFKDFEYIVIDAASTDGSKELLDKYSDKITYWVSEPDTGIYNGMNKGVLQAKGEYLLFLNSGDYLAENNVLQNASNNMLDDVDIYYGNLNIINKEGVIVLKKYPSNLSFYYFFKAGGHLPHPALFTKRALFDKIGLYREKFKIVADWAFYVNAICKWNCSYKYIDVIITDFDTTGISSNSRELLLEEKFISLNDNFYMFVNDYTRLLYFDNNEKYIKIFRILMNNRLMKSIYNKLNEFIK